MSHAPDAETLAAHFRHLVPKMLKDKGKIGDSMIETIMSWRHNSGFNVYCGHALWPDETVSNKNEQMARYYGYYSNKSRELRARAEKGLNENEEGSPKIVEPQASSKAFRKNWARLIQKIYEVDPLVCPKCQCVMRIVSIIDDDKVIKKILNHHKNGSF